MSMSHVTRLFTSNVVFVSLVLLAMLSTGGAGSAGVSKENPINAGSDKAIPIDNFGKSQGPRSRDLENKLPKHLPISVNLKREKAEAFGDLENEKWLRDLELEVKNTGDKPIYFLRLVLIPETNKPASERTLSLTIQYGRDELVSFETSLTPEDVPIQPGDTVFLKIRPEELNGWDHFRRVEQWPAEWSKPKKATLMFEILSFGDGTGFDGGDGVPRQRKKPERTAVSGSRGGDFSGPAA